MVFSRGSAPLAESSGAVENTSRAAAVEHADAVDALLAPDGLHHFVRGLAMIVEHGVPGGAGDAFGKLVRAGDHGVEQMPLLGPHGDQAGDGADDHDDERQ